MRRSDAEIVLEIAALDAEASKYDTAEQTDVTLIAAGAHDALRWALGQAEQPISEKFQEG
jgi:hypothetical protein